LTRARSEGFALGMANVLSEQKRQQVIALGRLGWPLRRIEREVGVRRETASAYLKAAGIVVRRERGRRLAANPASQVSTDSKPASGVSTDPGAARQLSGDVPTPPPEEGKEQAKSKCEEHREFIEDSRAKGRNAVAIYQDLVTYHGFTAKYASVRRFVRKLGAREPRPRAVIQTAPGEEAQVDYGDGPMVLDPHSGRYRRTRLFVLTLGFSRKCVRLLTFRSSSRIWADLHEQAFARLGGAPKLVVLDNLKEGVLKPDVYDPTINPLFRDLLAHYGVTAMPCRVRDPDRKGKVERGVGHAQGTPLKGQRFATLAEAQEYLDRWERTWADTRIHGTTKRQVAAMFAEELPHLLPLPTEPFRFYQYGERGVNLDNHVEVDRGFYSAPPGYIGHSVQVQWDDKHVRILDRHSGELLREHLRERPGRYRTAEADRPKHVPPTTRDLLDRSARLGVAVGAVCRQIHALDGQTGIRRIQGVLAFARKYGVDELVDACRAACDLGTPTYRFVKLYLERRPRPMLSLKHIDPLIRDLTHYRDLIAQAAPNQEDNR